ncbi:TonB-dependent receptor [Prosthecobacter sp. SYSU 5D2]|uniref:TonB-dependent receptor n=1 Tax=Prosthecobacter sp. SYSU 5D2 TaxID=3134134 RepID=UPI0031FF3D5E
MRKSTPELVRRSLIIHAWFFICLLLLCSAGLILAQEGLRGGLRGAIKDADFYVGVPDVTVMLEPGGQTVRTDKEGRFFINDIPPGVYRLAVSGEGYIRTSQSGVVVTAGSVREVDVDMTAEVVELDEFTVQELISEDSTVMPLSIGASLQSFASAISPTLLKSGGASGDIGSALKRLSSTAVVDSRYVVVRGLSDRYNVVVLNGARLPSSDPDKRAVNIDIFPTGLLETVVSSKTAVASMPGEVTGGYLNIITKRIPAEPFFTISMSTGYNTESTGTGRFLSYRGGGTGFLGSADTRALPSIMQDINALPSGNGTRTYLEPDGSPGAPAQTPTDIANAQFSANRLAAARALSGRGMGTSYKDAPMDFSFSAIGGTRIDDFMGGTLGLIGGVTYGKKYITETGIRGFANVGAGTPAPTEQFVFEKGQESLLAGALLSGSLEFSPGNSVTLTYFANLSAQDDAIFSYGETAALGTLGNGVPLDQEEIIIFKEFQFYTERRLQTLQLAGEHTLEGMSDIKIDWQAAYSMSSQDQPDLRKANYAYSYDLNSIVGTGDPAPPDLERTWRRLDDTNFNIAFNAEIPLDEGAKNGGTGTKFKFGGSFDHSKRDYVTDNFEYVGLPSDILIRNYLGLTPDQGYLVRPPTADNNLNLSLGDLIGDLDQIDRTTVPNPFVPGTNTVRDNFFLARAFNIPPRESYQAYQTIPAFYGSLTFSMMDDFETTVGARVEVTRMEIQVDVQSAGGSSATGDFLSQFDSLDFELNRTDLLPSLSNRWKIADNMALRSSISRTVARPTFKEIALVFSRDPETGNFFVGNPGLEMSSIMNYDLRWEWNPNPGDAFALSFFAKQIDKPIEFVNLGVFNTARNEESAVLFGFEVEAYKELGSLIPALEGFSLGLNYGFVYSKVDLSTESEDIRRQAGLSLDRPLQGQPEYTFNANLSYDIKDWGLTSAVLLNVTGPLLYTVGGRFESNLTPDIYQRPFTSLDLAFSKRITDAWSFNFRISNLLNQPRERYFDGGLPFSVTTVGTGYSIGITGKW